MTSEGDLLWEPSAARIDRARLTSFASWLGERGRDVASYDALWEWSVADIDGFWSAAAEWFGVRWQTAPGQALTDASMPGAQWFPGGTLNYAEHALYPPCGVGKDDLAVFFAREDGLEQTLTWRELRTRVAAVRTALVRHGVG